MKAFALATMVLLTGTAFAQAKKPTPPPAITYQQAIANEQKLFAADQKHDMETIKSLVADDFVDVGEDGSSIGKTALLKEIPTLKLLRYSQNNYRVVSLGPFAYAISYDSDATAVGANGKENRSQHGLNTVWIWRDGRWQILMHCRGPQKILTGK